MALTKEDLQSIRALMQEEMEPIRADISGMKDDIQRIDGKLSGLQQGQAGLRADVEKGFKDTRKAITEVVDAVDKKFERLETTA